MKLSYKRAEQCRLCKSANLVQFLDLGKMALAGAFVKKDEFEKEKEFPLTISFCKDCSFVQTTDIVSKDELFQKHFYLTSVSKTLADHFAEEAKEMVDNFHIKNALEFGSNDGALLKPLKDLGVKVIGVEPCKQVAEVSTKRGVNVVVDFFSEDLAKKLAEKFGKVDAVFANNVFAHISDLDNVIRGIDAILKDDGIFVSESHYLIDMIKELQYDMIYHEHMSYYSVLALKPYFEKFGMEIFDLKRISIHSGSIRVYVRKKGVRKEPISKNVQEFIELEKGMGLDKLDTFLRFAKDVEDTRTKLVDTLKRLKKEGKKVVGFGAGGRCTVISNYCKLSPELVEYVADDSPMRQNKYVPGAHIPTLPTEKIKEENPDYIVLFAWNYKDFIIKKYEWYTKNGGKFIIPLPEVKIEP